MGGGGGGGPAPCLSPGPREKQNRPCVTQDYVGKNATLYMVISYLTIPEFSQDYVGKDVTPDNFINILTGNAAAMKGIGSGKVGQSF